MTQSDHNSTVLRQQAGSQLDLSPGKKTQPRSADELLLELQTHRIELEMQNEQLRATQAELEESRDIYLDLYEFAPVSYITLDETGMISAINLTASSLFEKERKGLLHRPFGAFVVAKQRDCWNRMFENLLVLPGKQNFELSLQKSTGEIFHAYLDCMPVRTDGKSAAVRISLTDITYWRQAEEALREWQRFVEYTPTGLSIGKLADRSIKLVNPAFARMHGYAAEELYDIKAETLYAPESRAIFLAYTEYMHHNKHCNFECVRLRKDGSTFPAIVDISVVDGINGNNSAIFSVTDITVRKLSEEALKLYKAAIDTSMDGFWMFDTSGHLRQVNTAYTQLSGFAADELLNMHISQLEAKETSVRQVAAHIKKVIARGYDQFETRHRRKDGREIDLAVSTTFMPGSQILCAFLRDITERKQMERQLHEHTAHLQAVREEEKTVIAREIHDDLGGTLTALKMETDWLAEELASCAQTCEKTTPFGKHIATMTQLIENATNVMRRIITGLRPSILDDLGLLAALEWKAEQFKQSSGIQCRINCLAEQDCDKYLNNTQSINLFRIFQEALTNVARHSGASRVEVELVCNDEEGVMLSISDNGRGQQKKHSDAPASYGILGMTERVEQMGGTIKLNSPRGGGFSITVNLPPAGNKPEETA